MSYPLIILGGGLSGLAAGIRYARFDNKVLILEQHSKPGGLNSYYHRGGYLLETGLHAITNYATPEKRHAPLNRLCRQLKLSRRQFATHEQYASEIYFPHCGRLVFTNHFPDFIEEIARLFPAAIDRFLALVADMDAMDPLTPQPWISARERLTRILGDPLLVDFLFCPIMFYGSSQEYDMDYYQFVILFRSILQEGLFRPQGSIRDFLDLLTQHYRAFGGNIRFNSPAVKILISGSGEDAERVIGVRLQSGEEILCDRLLSTIGWPETLQLLGATDKDGREPTALTGRLSFMESIYILSSGARTLLPQDRTIIFYNNSDRFQYRRPDAAVDFNSGILCFPDNFKGLEKRDIIQLRVTHLANYQYWHDASKSTSGDRYTELKDASTQASRQRIRKIIGNFEENIVYEDSFTPLTIERYTSRLQGAVYGSPYKIKNGQTHFANLYLAGTDQGFLGIIGAMLSGVSMVNQYMFE